MDKINKGICKEFLMDDMKDFVKGVLGGLKKKVEQPIVELKENFDEEMEVEVVEVVKEEMEVERTITPTSSLNFIGSFNYVPDSREYPQGTQYRNVNEGIVYINHNNLWEEYVRDGKKGDTPRWSPSGGGLGERDVKKVTGQLGIFYSQEEANAFVANNPDLVRAGCSSTIAGVHSVYTPGVGWVAGFDDDALLVIGDSRVAYEGRYTTDGTLQNVAYGHAGPVNWMQQILGDFRFKRLHLRGRSGIRAFDVATGSVQGWDVASILASSDARHVLIRLGTNDLSLANTFTADEIYGYICTIVDAALKQGRTVHVSTVEPRDLIGGYVAANTIRGVTLNLLLQSISYRRERAFCVDVTKQFTDFAQTTKYTPIISSAASVVHDGLHASIRGAYVIGLALKNHFSAFRRNAFQYGSIHFLDTKANGATGRKQLISGPMMNTGMNTMARTGFTYSTVTAPNGVGSALRVDVDASSATSWTQSIAYQDIQITNADFQAGSTLYGYARIRVSGPGGTGMPNLLKGVAISAQVDRNNSTGFVQGADASRTDPDNTGGYANASACEFTGDLLLVTPKFTFNGGETYANPYLWFFVKSLAGASYRLEIYDAGVILEKAGTPDQFPQFWSDTTPPVSVP